MRRFEYRDQRSMKFWEVSCEGSSLSVHFGRIGTRGQTKTTELASPQDAAAKLERLVREKTKEGYVEVQGIQANAVEARAPSETVAAALKALADVEEWFADHGAQSVVDALNGPVSEEALAAAEAELGHALPEELRAVYRVHDGQRDVEIGTTFFRHGLGYFVPLKSALLFESMRTRFIGRWFEPGLSQAEIDAVVRQSMSQNLKLETDVPVPRAWIDLDESRTKPEELLAEECSTAWFIFAWEEHFVGVLHLRSGRVFEWAKDEGLAYLAPSFGAFLARFADDLWADKHALERDPFADDEPLEERRWVWAR